MEGSTGTGFMAVFAVSGSVVFLAMQIQKRLLSSFMEKMEFEINYSTGSKHSTETTTKKKVTFADEERELSCGETNTNNRSKMIKNSNESLETMPQNWQAMYKGILQDRNLRADY